MYQIISHDYYGNLYEDFKVHSFITAKRIALMLSSPDIIITVNLLDNETDEYIKEIDFWKPWK